MAERKKLIHVERVEEMEFGKVKFIIYSDLTAEELRGIEGVLYVLPPRTGELDKEWMRVSVSPLYDAEEVEAEIVALASAKAQAPTS